MLNIQMQTLNLSSKQMEHRMLFQPKRLSMLATLPHRKKQADRDKPGKREETNIKQKKKYHEDEDHRDQRNEHKRQRTAEIRNDRLPGESALAQENVPTFTLTDLSMISNATRGLLDVGHALFPHDNFAGSSTGAVFPQPQRPSAQIETMPGSDTDVLLHSLVKGSLKSAVVHRNQFDLGACGELVSSFELVRKVLKGGSIIVCKPNGTTLQVGVDVVLSYFDPTLMTNIPLLKSLATKLINEANNKGMISLIALLHSNGGVARECALQAETQTNTTIHRDNRFFPLEGVAQRDGSRSRKTPFVISATVLVSGVLASMQKGDISFTSRCTKSLQNSLAKQISRHLKFVAPAKPDHESNSDDYDSDEEEDNNDKKLAAKATAPLKNRDLNSAESTATKKEEEKSIPKDQVPDDLRYKTVMVTGRLTNDLTKTKIKKAVSCLESVKYCERLPKMNAKNKASLLLILGDGNEDDLKQKAIREHKLKTIDSDTASRLLGPYMP